MPVVYTIFRDCILAVDFGGIEKKDKDGKVRFDRQKTFALCMSFFFRS